MSEQDAQQTTSESALAPQPSSETTLEQSAESASTPIIQPTGPEPEQAQPPPPEQAPAPPVVEQIPPEPPADPTIVNIEAQTEPAKPPAEIVIPVVVPEPLVETAPVVNSPVPDKQLTESPPQPTPDSTEVQGTVGFQQSVMPASTEPATPPPINQEAGTAMVESPKEPSAPLVEPPPMNVVEVPIETAAPTVTSPVVEVQAQPLAPVAEVPVEPPAPDVKVLVEPPAPVAMVPVEMPAPEVLPPPVVEAPVVQPVPVVENLVESPVTAPTTVVAHSTPPTTASASESSAQQLPEQSPKETTTSPPTIVPVVNSSTEVIPVTKDPADPTASTPVVEVPVSPSSALSERQVLSPILELSSAERSASEASTQIEAVSAPTSPASVVIIEPIEHHDEITPLPSPAPTISPPAPITPGPPLVDETIMQLPPPIVENPSNVLVDQPAPILPTTIETAKPVEMIGPQRVEPAAIEQPPAVAVVEDTKLRAPTDIPRQEDVPIVPPRVDTSAAIDIPPQAPVVVTETAPEVPEIAHIDVHTAVETVPAPVVPPNTPEVPIIPSIVLTKPDPRPINPYDDPKLGTPVAETKTNSAYSKVTPTRKYNNFLDHFKMKHHFKLDGDKPRKRDRTRAKLFSEGLLAFSLGRRHAVIVKPMLDDASTRPRKAQQKFNAPENVSRARQRMEKRLRGGAGARTK